MGSFLFNLLTFIVKNSTWVQVGINQHLSLFLLNQKLSDVINKKSPFQRIITTTYQNPEENVLQLVTISSSAKKI